jgi:hypothetical protein
VSQDTVTSNENLVPVTGLEVWQLTPEMKQTLDDLSKEVFGSASTWKKLIKKGEIIQDTENKKAKRWVPLTLGEVATRMVIVKEQRDLEAKKAAEAKTQGELNAQSNQEVASSPSVDSAAGATDQSGPAN